MDSISRTLMSEMKVHDICNFLKICTFSPEKGRANQGITLIQLAKCPIMNPPLCRQIPEIETFRFPGATCGWVSSLSWHEYIICFIYCPISGNIQQNVKYNPRLTLMYLTKHHIIPIV